MALVAAPSIADPRLSTRWHEGTVQRRRILLGAGVAVAILGAAALVVLLEVVSVVVALTWVALGAIAWRPLVGLYVALGMVMLFEAGGADQLMLPGFYFNSGLSGSLGVPIISSPLELLLVLTFASWLGRLACSRVREFHKGVLF